MTSQALISKIHCTLSANQERDSQWVECTVNIIIIHDQEMIFANPVPQDAGVTGPRLILILIFGTVQTHPWGKQRHCLLLNFAFLKQFCDMYMHTHMYSIKSICIYNYTPTARLFEHLLQLWVSCFLRSNHQATARNNGISISFSNFLIVLHLLTSF